MVNLDKKWEKIKEKSCCEKSLFRAFEMVFKLMPVEALIGINGSNGNIQQTYALINWTFAYGKSVHYHYYQQFIKMWEHQTNTYIYITVKDKSQFGEMPTDKKESLKELDKKWIDLCDISDGVDVQETLACIEEHWAEELEARQRGEKMLIHISHISFPKLTYLNLGSSNIDSVEVLPRMHIPQLQTLNLDHNNISTLKTLCKADFSRLEALLLYDNELRELNGLQQANFPCMGQLSFEWYSSTGPQGVSCLLKLSTKSVKELNILRKTRIGQLSIRKQLKAKYPAVKIKYYGR